MSHAYQTSQPNYTGQTVVRKAGTSRTRRNNSLGSNVSNTRADDSNSDAETVGEHEDEDEQNCDQGEDETHE